ncbi:hypothetical protein PMAYCL1PPCAC_15885, partial [Pristionchus mayeri]
TSSSSSHRGPSAIPARAIIPLHAVTLVLLCLRRLFLQLFVISVASVSVDVVRLEEHALIDAVIVVEGYEGKAAVLVPHFVFHDVDLLDVSELGEVLLEHIVGVVLAYARYVQPLGGDVSGAAVVRISRNCSLRVDSLAIDHVRTGLLALINLKLGGVGHESKSARALRRRVAHHDNVDQLAVLAIELTHHLFGRIGSEPSDEELPAVLGLAVGSIMMVIL